MTISFLGVLSLTPRSASFLGGIIVTVAGPCFTPREQVTLDFLDNTGEYNNNIVCEYVSETKVTCFLEALDTLGLQQVRLSTPGDNADEVYVIGYSTFQVCKCCIHHYYSLKPYLHASIYNKLSFNFNIQTVN